MNDKAQEGMLPAPAKKNVLAAIKVPALRHDLSEANFGALEFINPDEQFKMPPILWNAELRKRCTPNLNLSIKDALEASEGRALEYVQILGRTSIFIEFDPNQITTFDAYKDLFFELYRHFTESGIPLDSIDVSDDRMKEDFLRKSADQNPSVMLFLDPNADISTLGPGGVTLVSAIVSLDLARKGEEVKAINLPSLPYFTE